MYKNPPLLFIIVLLFHFQSQAQLCEGNLGDPLVEIDFGSGSGRGDALGEAITAFTYSSSGELDEGEYTIANTTSGLKANAWHVTNDHTGNNNGYMMVINSAVLASEGVFYTKTVNGLCANTTYEFSAWLINIMNPSVGTDQYHPDVTFRISNTSGTILGTYNTGDISQTSSGTWLQYGFYFTLDNDTEVIITMLNSAPSAHPGNDIALDDIAFRPCGPTITNTIDNEFTSNLSVCEDENINATFETTVSSGYIDPQYQWQYSNDYGTTWTDIPGETSLVFNFTDTSISGIFLYRITVANGININTTSCRIVSDNFNIEIIPTPETLTGNSEQFFCTTQNPTINDIEVSATAVWYDSVTDGNLLASTTNLINNTTYYAAQATSNGCESDVRLAVLIYIVAPTLSIHNIDTIVCNTLNDASEIINLTDYETEITTCNDCVFSYFLSENDAQIFNEVNEISDPSNYNHSIENVIVYARIDSSDHCYQIAQITIQLSDTPLIPISDFIGFCEDDNYTIIDAGSDFDSYLWSTGETSQLISISNENIGDYWVTVTEDHATYTCASTKYFEAIPSNKAIIDDIIIKDWSYDDNTVTVILSNTSLGDYEYSLDNITYQDNNTFTALITGEYIVYIRDKNGCGVTEQIVYLLNYPKYFTPNGDGYHDNWFINYSETEPNMIIKIFDRYGKILRILDTETSWDGTYNGQEMPTSDYWFSIIRENGKTYTGHFTLKR